MFGRSPSSRPAALLASTNAPSSPPPLLSSPLHSFFFSSSFSSSSSDSLRVDQLSPITGRRARVGPLDGAPRGYPPRTPLVRNSSPRGRTRALWPRTSVPERRRKPRALYSAHRATEKEGNREKEIEDKSERERERERERARKRERSVRERERERCAHRERKRERRTVYTHSATRQTDGGKGKNKERALASATIKQSIDWILSKRGRPIEGRKRTRRDL